MDYWPWWNQKKWKCWYLFRTLHLETRCMETWVSEYWKRGTHDSVVRQKPYSSILWQLEIAIKLNPMVKTDGNFFPPQREYWNSRVIQKPEHCVQFLQVLLLVQSAKFLLIEPLFRTQNIICVNEIHNSQHKRQVQQGIARKNSRIRRKGNHSTVAMLAQAISCSNVRCVFPA